MKLSSYVTGLALVLVSTIILSTAGLMARMVSLDSATIVVWRGLAGGVALFFVLFASSPRRSLKALANLGLPGLAVAILTAIGMTLFIIALQTTSVAHVSIIFATCPFVAAGLGLLMLGERPHRGAVITSIVALAGVVVMVGVGEAGGLFGDLMALLMTFCIALTTVLVRRYPEQPVLISAGLAAFLSALVALPFASPFTASGHDIAIVTSFGVAGFALGIGLLLHGAKLLPPVETALIGALDAPLAPLWVWLFLGERLDRATVIGGTVVMAAVVFHVLADLRRRDAVARAARS